MDRRNIALQKVFSIALTFAISFLALLPSLGWAWHSVLPEHEHWFIGSFHEDAHSLTERFAQNDCVASQNRAAIVHVPSFGALQIVALAMGLTIPFSISIPDSFAKLSISKSLHLLPLFLPLFDPPPKLV